MFSTWTVEEMQKVLTLNPDQIQPDNWATKENVYKRILYNSKELLC